jgi:hypothetical protein
MKFFSNLFSFGRSKSAESESDVSSAPSTGTEFEGADSTIFFLSSDYDGAAAPFIVDLPLKKPTAAQAMWYYETRRDAVDGSIAVHEATMGGRMGIRPALGMALPDAAGVICQIGSNEYPMSADQAYHGYALNSVVGTMSNAVKFRKEKEATASAGPTPLVAIVHVKEDATTEEEVETWLETEKLRKELGAAATLHCVLLRSCDTPTDAMAAALTIIAEHSAAKKPIADALRTLAPQSKARTDAARSVLDKVARSLATDAVDTSAPAPAPVAA